MKIKCTVCNKEFYYGDHNSPMFIDEVWNKIINYFKDKRARNLWF